jgi:threonine synthase
MAYRCASCGTLVPWTRLARHGVCPNRDTADDGDHVLRREIDAARVSWPDGPVANPLLRYRTLLSSWHVARAHGEADDVWVGRAEWLDKRIAEIDGGGFVVTPFGPYDRLGLALGLRSGSLWVKDETRNVSGSHKARHLAGVALHLLADQAEPDPVRPGRCRSTSWPPWTTCRIR